MGKSRPNKGVVSGALTMEPVKQFPLLGSAGRVIDGLSSVAGGLAGIMAVLCAGIIVYGIVARYFFNFATVWEMSLTTYLLVLFGFLSASYGLKSDAHVRVDLLITFLSARSQTAFRLIGNLGVFIFAGVYSYYAAGLFNHSYRIGEMDPVIPTLPVWPIKGGMLVGTSLLCLQAIKMALSDWAALRRKSPHEETRSWDRPLLLVPLFLVLLVTGFIIFEMSFALGLIVLMIVILFSGVPVAFGLGLVGGFGFLVTVGPEYLTNIPNIGYANLNSFVLIALPLFILAGQIIQSSGMSEKIFNVCAAFIGHIPGGVGAATILSCAIFAALSGSNAANAATMGVIAAPSLIALGYSRKLAFGLIAAGGTLGVLIPPSNSMILIGVVTEESIGKLFMAGLIPGIILMLLLMATVILIHRRGQRQGKLYQIKPKASWQERGTALRQGSLALLLPVIMLGGMYSGIFTAIEAAAIAVVYSVVVVLLTGSVRPRDFPRVLMDSTKNIAMILMIFVGAMILGGYITTMQIPQKLAAGVMAANMSNFQFTLIIMLVLLVMGMFMEAGAITLVVMPIIFPMLKALDINLIWFAVLFTINMEIACISPPVGLNLYVVQRVTNATFEEVVRGVMWFVPALFLALIIMWVFPELSLWIPRAMG